MNEQEKNTEDTSTPNPESQVETTTTDVSEPVAENKEEAMTETAAPAEEVKEVVAEATTEAKADVTATKASPVAMVTACVAKAKSWVLGRKYTISAVVLVLVALVGLLYIMEEQGRVETGVFDKVSKVFGGHTAVAVVNGEKITRGELDTSVAQIAAGAAAQGMDTTDPELSAQIRSQAVDMLVNT
ncbi:MAG: hypothetical protein RL538_888, partial [Candidatus Parcubacteria bacterium]